jgi:hypothetical protein
MDLENPLKKPKENLVKRLKLCEIDLSKISEVTAK